MHEVLVNLLGGLRLPRKRVVRLTDCLAGGWRVPSVQYYATTPCSTPNLYDKLTRLWLFFTQTFILVVGGAIFSFDMNMSKKMSKTGISPCLLEFP